MICVHFERERGIPLSLSPPGSSRDPQSCATSHRRASERCFSENVPNLSAEIPGPCPHHRSKHGTREDALHNAYLSGYLNLRHFEGRSALTTWFTRIVVNAALMVQRKRRPWRIVPPAETNTPHESNWTERFVSLQPDPEVAHGEQETLQLINERLRKMNPLLRQAFSMIYCEDLSVREACALLGVRSSTFKARLSRARRQLARQVPRVMVAPVHRRQLAAGSSRPLFM